MGVFVRRVKTASGATAVQIVHKRRVLSTGHIGSARTGDELAVLLQVAEERRHAGQLAVDPGDAGAGGAGTSAAAGGTASLILREVLAGTRLGVGMFRALVLARVIAPASKLDTVRVLTGIGVASPHRVTFMLPQALRSATITIGARQVTAQPRIPAEARTLLNDLGWSGH